jgi:hypothetical protein
MLSWILDRSLFRSRDRGYRERRRQRDCDGAIAHEQRLQSRTDSIRHLHHRSSRLSCFVSLGRCGDVFADDTTISTRSIVRPPFGGPVAFSPSADRTQPCPESALL